MFFIFVQILKRGKPKKKKNAPPPSEKRPKKKNRLGRVTNRRFLFYFYFFGAPKNRRFSAPKTKKRFFRRAPKEQRPIFDAPFLLYRRITGPIVLTLPNRCRLRLEGDRSDLNVSSVASGVADTVADDLEFAIQSRTKLSSVFSHPETSAASIPQAAVVLVPLASTNKK